jgi:hypothetical protein
MQLEVTNCALQAPPDLTGGPLALNRFRYDHGDSVLLWKSMFPSSDMHSVDNGDFIPGWQSQVRSGF